MPLRWSSDDRRLRYAEHPGELPERYLDPHSGQEADEDRSGDEVGEETEPRDPSEQQDPGGDERGEAREGEPLVGSRLEPGHAQLAIPAYRIAAVAESPPTTRCREDPSSANTIAGKRIV